MLEYRGYGSSTGTPDEKGLNIDAQTALDYMRQREDIKKTKFVVYGQSLGGAVSISLVAKNQQQGDIKALVLENTFLSIKKLIPRCVTTPCLHRFFNINTSTAVSYLQQNTLPLSVISIGLAKT